MGRFDTNVGQPVAAAGIRVSLVRRPNKMTREGRGEGRGAGWGEGRGEGRGEGWGEGRRAGRGGESRPCTRWRVEHGADGADEQTSRRADQHQRHALCTLSPHCLPALGTRPALCLPAPPSPSGLRELRRGVEERRQHQASCAPSCAAPWPPTASRTQSSIHLHTSVFHTPHRQIHLTGKYTSPANTPHRQIHLTGTRAGRGLPRIKAGPACRTNRARSVARSGRVRVPGTACGRAAGG
jgi:hypothetical protein